MSNAKEGHVKDEIQVTGEVLDVSNSIFVVEVLFGDSKTTIKAYPSGKMRKHSIKILKGDIVDVVLSPYDLTRGRVVHRYSTKD